MATIRYSPIITSVRGSVGNCTFQQSMGGATLRNKPVPTNRKSDAQILIRQVTNQVVSAWRTLTDAQRKQWNSFQQYSPDYQRKNVDLALSGYNLFVKYNCLRLIQGVDIVEEIVYNSFVAPEQTYNFSTQSDNLTLYFPLSIDPAEWYFQLRITAPVSHQSQVYWNRLKYIVVTPADNDEFDITAAYIAMYGAVPASGTYIYSELRFFNAEKPVCFSPIRLIKAVSY